MSRLELPDGKYTVINELHEGGGFRALRYGEEWRSLSGDNLVLEMYHEIERYKGLVEHFANDYREYDSTEGMAEVAKAYLSGTEDEDR